MPRLVRVPIAITLLIVTGLCVVIGFRASTTGSGAVAVRVICMAVGLASLLTAGALIFNSPVTSANSDGARRPDDEG